MPLFITLLRHCRDYQMIIDSFHTPFDYAFRHYAITPFSPLRHYYAIIDISASWLFDIVFHYFIDIFAIFAA